ncbi:hypothetical protein QBC38DRAFT_200727 [Podospora fimiseda]|uniref:Uncharacterized protein n=1 Tax=Podospora fimiseda TaxID=252190 RepID=A0AAN7H413_9PEZI|nr:hypothetical protein QBC38DRAFT_200727 [Podospora fimiseda]
MDRGRGGGRGRATKKRATFPSYHHQFHDQTSNSPTPPPAGPHRSTTTSLSASTSSHRGGRARSINPTHHRPSSPAADTFRVTPRASTAADRFHSVVLESPSSSTATAANMTDAPTSARKRAKTFETTASFDGVEDEAHSKGGHSLRKRTRIDYNQMIDDELGLAAARNGDLASNRSATTPGARSRKRKRAYSQHDTDEHLVDFSSSHPNQKRRRADREPGHSRNNSRRRNPARKSASEISPYIYHPDNDAVQDTIMVGVSMDVAVTDDEESDHSSFQESDSSPSSPEGKQPEQSQPQQYDQSEEPTDSISRVEQDSKPVSPSHPPQGFQSCNAQPNEPNWVFATRLPAAPTQPSQVQQQQAREVTPTKILPLPEPLQETEGERSTEAKVVPTIQPTELAAAVSSEEAPSEQLLAEARAEEEKSKEAETVDRDVEMVEDKGRTESDQLVSSAKEPEQSTNQEEEATISVPALQQEPKSNEKTSSEPLPVPQADAPVEAQDKSEPSPPARTPARPLLRAPRPIGPVRLAHLEPIYAAETPYASQLGLEPYEGEDQVLPGPYTEWVYPDEGLATPAQTPTPTPTPTPMPKERGSGEVTWDVTQPLKEKQLFALHKQESSRRKAAGLPPISLTDFYNDCVRRHKAAKNQMARSGVGKGSASAAPFKAIVQQPTTSGDETPRNGSQGPESQVPTAAPSPAPADDDRMDDQEEEVIERPAAKRTNPADPNQLIEVTRYYPHQYSFPRVRDPTEISDLLENFEEMDTDTLRSTVTAAVEILHAYQREYHELKKILDDEENAKRRQANDKTIVNWENRQNFDEPLPFRRHHDEQIKGPPPFEVRGARAPKPYIDDQMLEHQREEDRIMAQVYGFKHNNHPTQVGRQNPEEQRWEMPETRLRERKRTEKGAELAEDNVVEGKRARKPRYVSDQSKDPSRSGTPILGPLTGRRQRKTTALAAVNGDGRATPEVMLPPPIENVPEVTPRRARAAAVVARARQMAEEREGTPIPVVAEPESMQVDEEEFSQPLKPTQKRVRGANKPPTSVPATESTKATKGKGRATKSQATTEISSSTFYSASANAQSNDQRPGTASSEESNRTAETNESAYSLRDKPKRNFVLENDPELEPRPKRRVRTAAAQKADTPPPQKADDANEGKKAKRVRKPTSTPATSAPAPQEPPRAPSPEPQHAPVPVPQPAELAYPPPPMISQQLAPPPPPPAPAGGLKAPTIFFTNPVTAPPPPPGPFMHTFNAVTSFPHTFPPPQADPPSIKKPITRIKVTNGFAQGGQSSSGKNGGSSEGRSSGGGKKVTKVKASKPQSAISPDGLINGKLPTLTQLAAEVPEKSYSEMSKSEKMSYSMRRRWASGEMQGAVEKRRTTLANKKAEKAGDGGSNPGSGSSTPQPQSGVLHPPPQVVQEPAQQPPPPPPQMMSITNSGLLALPGSYGDQGYMGMQPPIQMQMQQPQGYGGHGLGHSHGHPHGLPPSSPMQMVHGGQPGGQMVFQFPAAPPPPHQGYAPGQHY